MRRKVEMQPRTHDKSDAREVQINSPRLLENPFPLESVCTPVHHVPSMNPAWRKQILEEWRGVSAPKATKHNAKVIGDIVPDLMDSLGLSERYGEEEIGRVWTQVVGHPLCMQAIPVKLKHRTLHVRMIQPTVHYVLEGMRDELLTKLQARLGKERILSLKFAVN